MKSVLITGGNGALGSVLSNQLRQKGHAVVCGSRRAAPDQGSVHLDLNDPDQLQAAIHSLRPEVIFHLAATFEPDFEAAYATNVRGAMNLLAAMRQAGVSARVVLAGSAAEYGLVAPEENPLRETRVLRPVATYGLTKSWQTTWGLMCAHQGDDVVVARVFNLWGAGLSTRLFAGRVEQQIRSVLEGKQDRIEVGPLSAVRDYISLAEAGVQLMAIADHGIQGAVYHVASGQPTTMRELLAKRLAQDQLTMDIVDEAASLTTRTGYDVPVIYADITLTSALIAQTKP
jgi:nucleoside-diphosphate-sugar epimerase